MLADYESISATVFNVFAALGILVGGGFALFEYLRRRDLSARIDLAADWKILAVSSREILAVDVVISNIGAVRTLPLKISVELARIACDDSGIAFISLERQEVPVTHPGLHPWNMYIDAQEKMYRQAFFQLPVDSKAVRLTVSVDYDEEDYVAFREFTVDLDKYRSEKTGIVA